MSSKSLIILDIDKTIKPHTKPIPKEIYDEIKRLAYAGNIIVFATGRSLYDMRAIEREAEGANQYSVYVNGGVVSHKPEAEEYTILDKKTFNGTQIYDLLKENLEEHYTISDVFVPTFDTSGFIHKDIIDIYHDATGYTVVDHPAAAVRNELLKLSIVPENRQDIHKEAEKIDEIVSHLVSHHVYDNKIIEIGPYGVNKAEGMKQIFEEIHSHVDRVIAAGDNYNDIQLFDWVNSLGGESYAVGNAVTPLKKLATEVLPDIDNGGVLPLLKKL